jgi:hypothetical protein
MDFDDMSARLCCNNAEELLKISQHVVYSSGHNRKRGCSRLFCFQIQEFGSSSESANGSE